MNIKRKKIRKQHINKASSKRVLILVMIIGLLMLTLVTYGFYFGIKLNQANTLLVNSIFEIKLKTNAAHLQIDEFIRTGDNDALNSCRNNLDSADNKINWILADENFEEDLIFSSLQNDMKKDLFDLKNMLQEYKKLSIEKTNQHIIDDANLELDKQLNFRFNEISSLTGLLITNLIAEINYDAHTLALTYPAIIITTLFFILIVTGFIITSEKKRKTATNDLNKTSKLLDEKTEEQKSIKDDLEEWKHKHSRLIGNLPGMVYSCNNDEERTIRTISKACLSITGYKPEEFINSAKTSYVNIIHPEDRDSVNEQINTALQNKKPFQLVYRITTAPGFEKWIWEQGIGIYDNDNNATSIEGFIFDITEQRTSEAQLLLLSTALETAANGIMITDADGNIVWINAAFTKMTGYNSKEVFGKNASILKSGKHKQAYYKMLWDTINSGEVWRGELINQRKNGKYYDEEITISPVKDTLGRISHFIGIKDDISERKEAEKALKESEERFRGLYENATIGLYQISPHGKVLMANSAMIKMLGFNSFEELHFIDIERGYTNKEERKEFKKNIERDGVGIGFESAWQRSDRSIVYLRESSRAIKNDEGETLFYEGTIEDITNRKRAEYALIEAKEKAEKSDRIKTEFLAQMSHEIRTPINALLSFSNMIREEVEEKVDEDLKQGFRIIDIEGKRVIRTVDLILNMAQLQTDSYTPEIQMVDIYNDVITPAFNEYESMANEKDLQFILEKKTDNTFTMADEYSVKQMVNNLVDNAIKYTAAGKVEIIIDRDESERMLLRVSDTGIGISREYQKILFTPFTQEEHGYSRKFDGNGLGLALIKKYCELNNAEVKVESEKGKGSSFSIIFSS